MCVCVSTIKILHLKVISVVAGGTITVHSKLIREKGSLITLITLVTLITPITLITLITLICQVRAEKYAC